VDLVKLLISRGADVTVRDDKHQSAEDVARFYDQEAAAVFVAGLLQAAESKASHK
jgi:hypothetical protein